MNVQSVIFVLFLVAANLATTSSQAQLVPSQIQQEQQAAQEAYQLGRDTRQQEADRTQTYRSEQCSADALHWTFVSANRVDVSGSTIDQRPVVNKKVAATKPTTDRSGSTQSRAND